eukprot:TRINITY_DN10371_c0_g1_i1.p1 TRINITY_DN10371_c0_g1~~TRINITY_DN10371_c0_g1_i1.p1  ORF type:complete len:296 (-),score=53.16 TRINITY_DN10371_c0_g1_i1:45-932(-)
MKKNMLVCYLFPLFCLLSFVQSDNMTTMDDNGTDTTTDVIPEDTIILINIGIQIGVIVFGILFTFVGYRIHKVTFFIGGLLVGFFVIYAILLDKLPLWLVLIIAGGAGLIIGFLFTFVAVIGIFFLGAILGLAIAVAVLATPVGPLVQSLNLPWLFFVILGGSSLIFGILGVILQKVIMVLGTSFGGSFMIASAVDTLAVHSNFSKILTDALALKFQLDTGNWVEYVMIGAFILVGIVGCIVQFRFTARNYNHKKRKSTFKAGKDLSDDRDHNFKRAPETGSRGYKERIPLRPRN